MLVLKILCWLFLICAIGAVGLIIIPALEDIRCDNKGGDANIPTQYSFSEGCMFLIDGVWMPEAKVQFPK